MNKENTLKTILILLFIAFIGISISNKTGYYDYEFHKRVELTNEEIEKFEEDVKNNKEIDINDYRGNTIEDYSNKISKFGNSVSNITSKYIKKGINEILDTLNKLLS